MPIRAEFRKFYGREWQTETRPRILTRAGHQCEQCAKPNHATIETVKYVLPEMFGGYRMHWRHIGHAPGNTWIGQRGTVDLFQDFDQLHRVDTIRVVLTVAHLNHTPGDDRDENLAALCQWCHLIHDLQHHQESRATRKDQGRPLLVPPVVVC